MNITTPIVEICLICAHPAPAAHFADFYHELKKDFNWKFLARDKGLEVLQGRQVEALEALEALDIGKLSDDEVIEICRLAKCILVDVGHPYSEQILRAFKEKAPHIVRLAYYDNPEPYVGGGYSEMVEKALPLAQRVLYANKHLAKSPNAIGIGYSSLPAEIAKIEGLPRAHEKRTITYFGGANADYYERAFPRFLEILGEAALSDMRVVIQRHPRADKDKELFDAWKKMHPNLDVTISDLKDSNQMLAKSDVALYHQTSANVKFACFVPTIQVADKIYPDCLVESGLALSALNLEQFLKAVDQNNYRPEREKIMGLVGYDQNWPAALKKVLLFENLDQARVEVVVSTVDI